jgi:hypothetical protein
VHRYTDGMLAVFHGPRRFNGIHLTKQAIHLVKYQKFKKLLVAKNIFMAFQSLACF